MIFEAIFNMFFGLLELLLFSFKMSTDFLGLPFDVINGLATFTGYGAWVVGVDLLAVFGASVVFWWVFKGTVGVVVFLWRLLPFT